MSSYALPTLFPSSSCYNEQSFSSAQSILDHNNSISPHQSSINRESISVKELKYANTKNMKHVDIATTNVNLDPLALYNRSRNGKNTKSTHSSQFEAVTFELAITLNERRYTVRRPFRRLRKLHAELVKECEKLGMVMPELPIRYDSEGNAYTTPVMFPIARSGLSMLQSTMYTYTAVMDGWFSYVCKALPGSPSIINFVWEPPAKKSKQQLASINEDEEEDDSDEECYANV